MSCWDKKVISYLGSKRRINLPGSNNRESRSLLFFLGALLPSAKLALGACDSAPGAPASFAAFALHEIIVSILLLGETRWGEDFFTGDPRFHLPSPSETSCPHLRQVVPFVAGK